jgi:hypothetical protein
VFARPVSGQVDGADDVVDLLIAEMPLADVLSACASLVPDYVGSAAVVACVDGRSVVGAPPGSSAERLATDARWWENAMLRGQAFWPQCFAGFPADLAAWAREEGYESAWALPVRDQVTLEVFGCVVAWVKPSVERSIVTDEALRRAERLAGLVIVEELRRREMIAGSW